jgi:hypothetical protein
MAFKTWRYGGETRGDSEQARQIYGERFPKGYFPKHEPW